MEPLGRVVRHPRAPSPRVADGPRSSAVRCRRVRWGDLSVFRATHTLAYFFCLCLSPTFPRFLSFLSLLVFTGSVPSAMHLGSGMSRCTPLVPRGLPSNPKTVMTFFTTYTSLPPYEIVPHMHVPTSPIHILIPPQNCSPHTQPYPPRNISSHTHPYPPP